ncbi:MAG: hypothetical protein WC707_04870 [Candidatus Babeliaceae bacterium]|jgi:uncharacterized protein YvpB
MFKKILLVCLSLIYTTVQSVETNTIIEKKYGVTVELEASAEFFEKCNNICEILTIDSIDDIGNLLATGMPVWFAQSYQDAERMQEMLKKEGYTATITEVILYDAPDANVISLQDQLLRMQLITLAYSNLQL